METDAEAAGLGSLGGLEGGTRHPVDPGKPCRNCGGMVENRYCTTCGQLGADFHRPVWDLIASSLGDMLSIDGRLWRSLPLLMFRPGRMTREYIDGKRARFVPPFRLFLLTSVIFFLTVFTVLDQQSWLNEFKLSSGGSTSGEFVVAGDTRFNLDTQDAARALEVSLQDESLTPERRAELEASLKAVQSSNGLAAFLMPDGKINREALHLSLRRSNPDMTEAELATATAAADRAANFYENQDRFGTRMREWAPRFTLLFLPIFSLLLALSYAWHSKRYIYDHLITGLHFQTFVYVLATLLMLGSMVMPAMAPMAGGLAIIVVFFYLLRMLRVTYDTGYIMAFFRTGFLLLAGLIVLSLLAVGLIVLSFFLT